MSISPKITFWFGVFTSILLGVATGAVHLPSTLPPSVAAEVTSWAAFLGWVNTVVLTALTGYSSQKAGPLVAPPQAPPGKLVAALFIAFFVAFGCVAATPGPAAAKPRVKLALRAAPKKLAVIDTIVRKLETITLADVQTALALAGTGGDANGASCFKAVAGLITTIQTADAKPLPRLHLVTDFEKAHLIVMSLRQGSAFSAACAPLAEEVKMDLLTWLAAVADGTLSLTTFGL